jgi:hypothetical protein
MEKSDSPWKEEILEWGLECALRKEVPDLDIPFSKEEEIRLRPVRELSRRTLIEQRVSRSRMPTRPVNLDND